MRFEKAFIDSMMDYCSKKPGSYESRPFGENPICYKVMGKIFAQINAEEQFFRITVKCNPDRAELYRSMYPGVVQRGYHTPPVQQPYWNTIDMDRFDDSSMLLTMIDEAYDEVIGRFTKKERMKFNSISDMVYKYVKNDDPDFIELSEKACIAEDMSAVDNKVFRYRSEDHNSEINTIVVYSNDTAVACGGYKACGPERAELEILYTEPDCRRKGLCTEIVRRLEAWIKIEGMRWCMVNTQTSGEIVHHICEKLGYKAVQEFTQNEENSCIYMERKI